MSVRRSTSCHGHISRPYWPPGKIGYPNPRHGCRMLGKAALVVLTVACLRTRKGSGNE